MPGIPIEKDLVEFAHSLAAKQKRSGAWCSNEPNLESIVITCQALLFLSELNKTIFSKNISKAVGWLTRPNVSAHEYSYWATLPLIISGAQSKTIQSSLDNTKAKVKSGVLHHENSPLIPYYAECTYFANCDDGLAKKLIDNFATELESPIPEWTPERILYRYQNLALRKHKESVKLLDSLKREIKARSTFEGDLLYFSSLISTCYVMINFGNFLIYDCDEKIKSEIRPYFHGALKYIEKSWFENKFDSPPLAGGDIKNPIYFKTVAARALNKAYSALSPNWQTGVISRKYVLNKTILLFLSFFIFGALILWSEPKILHLLKSNILSIQPSAWQKIGKGADIIAYLSFISPFLYYLYSKYIKKD
jgi:hypothetical protein